MLKEIRFPKSGVYRSGTQQDALDFYINAFSHSNKLDLLLGYFSSTAIRLLSSSIASFISRGGTMRIIINHILTKNDKDLISGQIYDEKQFNLNDFHKLNHALSSNELHFFECLAFLIKEKRLEFTIIAPTDGAGIAHYKSGCFYDENGDSVYFKGSCNFSYSALINNLEEIDITTSWINDGKEKVQSQIDYFEAILDNKLDILKTIDTSKIEIAITEHFGNRDINELLESEVRIQEEFLNEYQTINPRSRQHNALLKIKQQTERLLTAPKFPFATGPFPYQIKAYHNWVENNYRGIFAMATGTGKTITSLNCLLNEWKKTSVYRALILVPTIALVDQWKKECREFNFKNVILVSSKSKWQDDLNNALMLSNLTESSFIVISTYASFATKRFKESISMFPDDTFLIADEAHNVGANQILKEFKKLKFTKRIGLSATPERIYDEITNLEINKLFNDSHPYIVSFTMAEALKQQILCSYKYYPVLIELTESESQQYYDITIQIAKIYASSNGDNEENESLKRLLLIRSSIINKASNKLSAFKKIISEIYSNNGKLEYMLVYTPEGSITEDLVDELTDNLEDMKIIDEYTMAIRDIAPNIYVSQYTSNSRNRPTILENFESGSINVLTSMKCLDEGVDIPRSEFAIFCSSTGNPRQFIQRRGRVLRRHPDKTLATIYDLVVVPNLQRQEKEENLMVFNNINRKLMRKELKRVNDFSSLSINYTFTEDLLRPYLDFYEIKLYEDE